MHWHHKGPVWRRKLARKYSQITALGSDMVHIAVNAPQSDAAYNTSDSGALSHNILCKSRRYKNQQLFQ